MLLNNGPRFLQTGKEIETRQKLTKQQEIKLLVPEKRFKINGTF
jgi:hypothetical protein